MAYHESHFVGRDIFRGDDKIAFIFAGGRVEGDDKLSAFWKKWLIGAMDGDSLEKDGRNLLLNASMVSSMLSSCSFVIPFVIEMVCSDACSISEGIVADGFETNSTKIEVNNKSYLLSISLQYRTAQLIVGIF